VGYEEDVVTTLGDGEVVPEEDQAGTTHRRRTTTIQSPQQGARVLQLGRKHGDLGFGQAHWEVQLLDTWPGTDPSSRGTKGCGEIKMDFGIATMTMGREAQVGEEEHGPLDLRLRLSRRLDMRVQASARPAEDETGCSVVTLSN